MRLIKKYPNRRLYDTELGEYITLENIKKLVFDRVEFKVIDARTKKDLSQSTLLQIIAEQEATSTPIFTTAVLQDFIRSYQEKSQHIFSQYLEQAMDLFIHQKKFFQNQWLVYQKLLTNPSLIQQLENSTKKKKTKKSKKNKNGLPLR